MTATEKYILAFIQKKDQVNSDSKERTFSPPGGASGRVASVSQKPARSSGPDIATSGKPNKKAQLAAHSIQRTSGFSAKSNTGPKSTSGISPNSSNLNATNPSPDKLIFKKAICVPTVSSPDTKCRTVENSTQGHRSTVSSRDNRGPGVHIHTRGHGRGKRGNKPAVEIPQTTNVWLRAGSPPPMPPNGGDYTTMDMPSGGNRGRGRGGKRGCGRGATAAINR